jgi:hypothetical protein
MNDLRVLILSILALSPWEVGFRIGAVLIVVILVVAIAIAAIGSRRHNRHLRAMRDETRFKDWLYWVNIWAIKYANSLDRSSYVYVDDETTRALFAKNVSPADAAAELEGVNAIASGEVSL